MYADDDLLSLSGIQHIAYCPRQWGLIHIDRAWEDNAETLRGEYFHMRVDLKGYATKGGVRSERRVHLVSRRLGLYGVADIVEFTGKDGGMKVRPVEYKVGSPKASDWDRLQVAAQAMCLEERLGVHVPTGSVFYGETRRRENFDISDELRGEVEGLSAKMHELYEIGKVPLPIATPRCRRCSLNEICMPQTSSLDAHGYWQRLEEKLVIDIEEAS